MPKQRKNGRSSDPQRPTRFPFRVISGIAFSNSAATTVGALNLTCANLGARVVAAAPDFEFFRINKLRAYTFSDIVGPVYVGTSTFTPPSASIAVAFDPVDSTDTTAPTTFAQMSQYGHAKFGNVYARLELDMHARDLWKATPTKWYNTTATGSPPALSLSAGVLYTANNVAIGSLSGVQNQYLVTEGEVEFMGPVTPALAASDYHPHVLTQVTMTPEEGPPSDDDWKSDVQDKPALGVGERSGQGRVQARPASVSRLAK